MAEQQVTVLEGIIADLGNELYQKWYNAATEDQKTEEMSRH